MTAITPLQRQLLAVMDPSERYPAWALADEIGESESLVARELVRLAARGEVEAVGDRCASQPLWTARGD